MKSEEFCMLQSADSPAATALIDNLDMMRAALASDGFVVVRQLLDGDALERFSESVDRLFSSSYPKSRQVLYVNGETPPQTPHLDSLLHQWLNPHRFSPEYSTASFIDAPRVVAEALMGAPPVLFQDLILVKESSQRPFPWHQDFPFWPVDQPRGVVCWMPLVHNVAEQGGLMFALGSHGEGSAPAVDLHRGKAQDVAAALPDIEARYKVVCPPMAPGDGVFFSPLIWHCSQRREGGGRRAAWSSIWLHPSVRWSHARTPAHPLCRETEDGAPVHALSSIRHISYTTPPRTGEV
jgi:ectoine hydroxylase-related dioxygenase (phytanoyl-CoA dioxygenase family)